MNTGTYEPSDHEIDDGEDEQNLPIKELYTLDYSMYSKRDKTEMSEVHGIKIARLPEHFLVADYGNYCLKLIGQDYAVVTRHRCLFQPWDLAIIDDVFFVVTFPFVRLIQMFKIKEVTQIHPWFPVKSQSEYYAVVATSQHLVVTCKYDGQNLTDTPSIHVMDHRGNVELIVKYGADGKQLFADPDYLTLDEALQTIYISDSGNQTVFSMDIRGNILAKYTNNTLEPRGITFDKNDGFVFVNDAHENTVLKLDQNLQAIEYIKCKRNSIKGILGSLYCSKTETLILTSNGFNIIQVFLFN